MNKEQAKVLTSDTCYLYEIIEQKFDQMKVYALTKDEKIIISKFLDDLLKINQKYSNYQELSR